MPPRHSSAAGDLECGRSLKLLCLFVSFFLSFFLPRATHAIQLYSTSEREFWSRFGESSFNLFLPIITVGLVYVRAFYWVLLSALLRHGPRAPFRHQCLVWRAIGSSTQ